MKNTITEEAAVEMLMNILNDVSGIAVDEIFIILDMISETLSHNQVQRFIGRIFKQWAFGESLTNPLIVFTKELKGGLYDNLTEDDVDLIHEAAVSIAPLWRSNPEVSTEQMKNNMGYFLIQRFILRIIGIAQNRDSDAKPDLETLSAS